MTLCHLCDCSCCPDKTIILIYKDVLRNLLSFANVIVAMTCIIFPTRKRPKTAASSGQAAAIDGVEEATGGMGGASLKSFTTSPIISNQMHPNAPAR